MSSFNEAAARNQAISSLMQGGALQPPQRRRLVRLYVSDPDCDVPTSDCLLMASAETLTDATDEELWLMADLPALIEAHNEKRKGWKLEPIRLRNLNRSVTTLVWI